MKKLIAVLLVAMMLIPAAVYACEGTGILPAKESTAEGLSGDVWVAMEKSTACLFGKLSPEEKTGVYPAQTACVKYVRGITVRGITRIKGEMRYMVVDGCVYGLTKVWASVRIEEEYKGIVSQIVARRMGEDAEMTAGNVIACTLYRTDSTVTHMLAGTKADKIAVGGIFFDGSAMEAGLYITDWNGDGLPDLVLAVNPGDPNKASATPEPEPETTPEPARPTQTAAPANNSCGGKRPCVQNIQINLGIVFNWIEQVFKGGCCKK